MTKGQLDAVSCACADVEPGVPCACLGATNVQGAARLHHGSRHSRPKLKGSQDANRWGVCATATQGLVWVMTGDRPWGCDGPHDRRAQPGSADACHPAFWPRQDPRFQVWDASTQRFVVARPGRAPFVASDGSPRNYAAYILGLAVVRSRDVVLQTYLGSRSFVREQVSPEMAHRVGLVWSLGGHQQMVVCRLGDKATLGAALAGQGGQACVLSKNHGAGDWSQVGLPFAPATVDEPPIPADQIVGHERLARLALAWVMSSEEQIDGCGLVPLAFPDPV